MTLIEFSISCGELLVVQSINAPYSGEGSFGKGTELLVEKKKHFILGWERWLSATVREKSPRLLLTPNSSERRKLSPNGRELNFSVTYLFLEAWKGREKSVRSDIAWLIWVSVSLTLYFFSFILFSLCYFHYIIIYYWCKDVRSLSKRSTEVHMIKRIVKSS